MLNVFNFNQAQPVRVEMDESGVPWFVAKDVCDVLGISKYRDVIARHLDDDERVSMNVDTLGGVQQMTSINESGVYALIFRSRKPQAKAFRKWVTSEVLPALRQTGSYSIPGEHADPRLTWGRKLEADAVIEFAGLPIRVLCKDASTRFVAVDCCKALGYKRPNIALQRLDAKFKRHDLLPDTMGRKVMMNTIDSSGALALAENSRLPRAESFHGFMQHDAITQVQQAAIQ